MVTFITTFLVSVVAMVVWRLNIMIVLGGFLVFGTLDLLFLSSALLKFPDGAWFTILVGGVLSCILLLWRFGKNQQWASEASDMSPTNLVNVGKGGELRLKVLNGDKELSMLKGTLPTLSHKVTISDTPKRTGHILRQSRLHVTNRLHTLLA